MTTITRKGISRRFRKALKAAGKTFPLTGAFNIRVGTRIISEVQHLPTVATLRRAKVLTIAPGSAVLVLVPPKKTAPAPVEVVSTSTERTLYKRSVREADPLKVGSKRRVDYRAVKNPKAGDGVTYYGKLAGKWVEVDAKFVNPALMLPGEIAA